MQSLGTLPKMPTEYFLPLQGMANLRINWDKLHDMVIETGTREALEFAGLIPSSHMSKAFREELVSVYQEREGEAREPREVSAEIEALALRHYDANNCQLVADMVERLKPAPELKRNKEVLDDVLKAHRAGADAITMHPLVLLIETMAFPFVDKMIDALPNEKERRDLIEQIVAQKQVWADNPSLWTEEKKTKERNNVRSRLKKPAHDDVAATLAVILEVTRWTPMLEGAGEMVDHLGRFFYKRSQKEDPPPVDPVTGLPRLNRHKVAHGILGLVFGAILPAAGLNL